MQEIEFRVDGHVLRTRDRAILLPDEEPIDALVQAVIDTVSTDIEVTVGDVTLHLAAWRDPEHWSEEWRDAFDGEEVDAASFVASHVTTTEPTS